jgi:hypothetical protein
MAQNAGHKDVIRYPLLVIVNVGISDLGPLSFEPVSLVSPDFPPRTSSVR